MAGLKTGNLDKDSAYPVSLLDMNKHIFSK